MEALYQSYVILQDVTPILRVRSVPGVGPVLSTTVRANLPELGTLTNKEIAALVSVAPLNYDSGTLHGKRMVWGKRAQAWGTLYMALIACMRKLLTMLNTMLKHRMRWWTELPQHA